MEELLPEIAQLRFAHCGQGGKTFFNRIRHRKTSQLDIHASLGLNSQVGCQAKLSAWQNFKVVHFPLVFDLGAACCSGKRLLTIVDCPLGQALLY
jgi:hypothetical protein